MIQIIDDLPIPKIGIRELSCKSKSNPMRTRNKFCLKIIAQFQNIVFGIQTGLQNLAPMNPQFNAPNAKKKNNMPLRFTLDYRVSSAEKNLSCLNILET